ncbi:AbfB domain-containing protein [Kutzneria sp. NPDC052558]|uniref:AbfB domain-containing protein n=1 Tax=Kutzneria sp. NPDC052558 TaxID=3364121 RepID=UPI0037CBA236
MPTNRPGAVGRALLVAVTTTALTAGAVSGVAHAAPAVATATAAPQADRAAVAVAEATQEEKVNAIRALGIDIDNTWLVLRDRDFVFKIFDNADSARFPLVKDGALQSYRDGDTASTVFIRNGIYDLAQRDRDNWARAKVERDLARKLKQSAASLIAMPVTDQQLDLGYKDFIYKIWQFTRTAQDSKRVNAAALDAFGGSDADQKTFLESGLLAAVRQDQDDAIKAAKDASDAEKARLAARAAKTNAASVVLLPVDEAVLSLSDDNFIRKIIERAVPDSEVYNAAWAALRSTAPADWSAFITTGIFDANKRDIEIARQKKAAEDRAAVRELKARAENGRLQPRLVAAAAAALAGDDAGVAAFLKDGQYAVLTQSLQATTEVTEVRGSYAVSAGGDVNIWFGEAGTNGTATIADATWKVVAGLADPNCFSLESATVAGSFVRQHDLRVRLEANDGTTGFKNDATWCTRPALDGSADVSLESKAQPGRYLRHMNGGLWVGNDSGQNPSDSGYLFKNDATWHVADANPEVTTPIGQRWYNDDAFRQSVGAPKGAEVYDNGVRYRDYANARVYWSQATGAHSIAEPILTKYLAEGGHKAFLPVTDTTPTPTKPGRFNHFVGGISIYWSATTGAHLVYGAIRNHWQDLGWEKSYLGFPTADEFDIPGGRRSTFEGGHIDFNAATGAVVDVHGN